MKRLGYTKFAAQGGDWGSPITNEMARPADSPAGLAAWLLDHGDGYAQPAAAITSAVRGRTINGHSAGDLTRDDVLDNITLYWVTNTAISSARLYWENKVNLYLPADVAIPAAITVFP